MNVKTKRKLFYILSFGILLFATLFLSPLSDDWYYNTAPNLYATFADLLPKKAFWRPFDVAYGYLMGLCPVLFPVLNRALLIISHVVSVYLLKNILELLNIKRPIVQFCTLYAMFSSAIYATIASPDALNQSFSLLFGMIGMYLYFKDHNKLGYAICAVISVFWKESGIMWLVCIPFTEVLLSAESIKEVFTVKEKRRQTVKSIIIAAVLAIAYFAARFILQGSVSLGSTGKYSLSVFSFSTIKNFVNIFVNAMTGIDTVALFASPRNYLLVGLTALLSAVFLLIMLYACIRVIKQKKYILGLLAVIVNVALISLPHIVMESAGEMHTYPTLFAISIAYAYILDKAEINKKVFICGTLCIFVAFGITGAHKLIALYDYSDRTEAITEEMLELYDDAEDSLLVISVNEKVGYSVFSQSAIAGSHYGYSMKPHFGWVDLDIKCKKAKNLEAAEELVDELGSDYDKVWIVEKDKIEVIK